MGGIKHQQFDSNSSQVTHITKFWRQPIRSCFRKLLQKVGTAGFWWEHYFWQPGQWEVSKYLFLKIEEIGQKVEISRTPDLVKFIITLVKALEKGLINLNTYLQIWQYFYSRNLPPKWFRNWSRRSVNGPKQTFPTPPPNQPCKQSTHQTGC